MRLSLCPENLAAVPLPNGFESELYGDMLCDFLDGSALDHGVLPFRNVYDLLDDGDDTNLKKLYYHIEQQDVLAFDSKEFEPKLIRDLRNDLTKLEYLQDMWAEITDDPKLAEFRRQLRDNEILKGKKAIVFTESKETAEYLFRNLQDLYPNRIVYFSGQSSDYLKTEIEDSFNPQNKSKENDKYDLLITTDVLAEGINLHRANILFNYLLFLIRPKMIPIF